MKAIQKEEEMLFAEDSTDETSTTSKTKDKGLADSGPEIARLKGIIKKLRRKYKEAAEEIKDLTKEYAENKGELLDIIRI